LVIGHCLNNMDDRLKKLYQSVILKHNKEPHNYHINDSAAHRIEAYNPLCGDQFDLYFTISEGKITDVSFHGFGCAISKSATSVLVKQLEGKTIDAILQLCKDYQTVTNPEITQPTTDDEELLAFEAAKAFPERLKCATLSWEAIEEFLMSGEW